MQNYQQTIFAQFANSPTITTIIDAFNQWLDPSADIDLFYEFIWDIETAKGVGLDIWGRIVGVGRVLNVASGTYLGFANAGDSSEVGWSQTGIWYSGQPATGNYALTDDAFRTLIYAKALANICDGSIPGINSVLMLLFGASGDAYVTDGLDMTMTYTFSFELSPVQQAIVSASGIIPRSSGVAATIVQA